MPEVGKTNDVFASGEAITGFSTIVALVSVPFAEVVVFPSAEVGGA